MREVYASAQRIAVALVGCATAFNASAQVPATQYSSYDCARISAEQRRMYTLASDLASLGDTGAPEAEYARLRKEFGALREAATMKKCGKAPTQSRQQAAPDASAAQGGSGPRIAPPETPLE